MCLSANLTTILYSPGAVGRYDTLQVPSLLSWQVISALEGPSTARAKPPGPASLVTMVKLQGSSQITKTAPAPFLTCQRLRENTTSSSSSPTNTSWDLPSRPRSRALPSKRRPLRSALPRRSASK